MKVWKDLKQLGHDYFERVTHYEGFKNIDFRTTHCYAAPFGGPVAFTSFGNSNLKSQLDDHANYVPTIEIYTSAGIKLGVVNAMEFHQDVIAVGWNDVEDLVIVLSTGTVFLYGLTGELRRKLTLGDDVKKEGILETLIYGTGLVCYTKKKNFFVLLDFESKSPQRWASDKSGGTAPGSEKEDPICWTIIEPELTLDKSLEIIVSKSEGIEIVGKNHNNFMLYKDIGMSRAPSKLVISPSGKMLACYAEGELYVYQTDFTKQYVLFETSAGKSPDQIAWCGESAIVCYWRMELINFLLVIGMNADYFKYQDTEPLSMLTECDGLRIFSREGCDFLYPVPTNVVRVFNLPTKQGGVNLVHKLHQASILFKKEKKCVDDIIREIKKTSLPQAIEALTDAAASEFDVNLQQELLSSAAFGITFLDKAYVDTFKEATKIVRVINQMRSPKIGIPLSYTQYKILSPQLLIDRLIGRDEHMLAYEICDYLGLKTDKVLIRWATKKVLTRQTGKSEEFIAEAIKDRLKRSHGVSFASIAFEAYKAGREELATMLLDSEPRAADQVPLLVHMRKYELALEKAIISGDTNLIHLVLAVFKDDTENGMGNIIDFENILRRLKPARAVWNQVCKETSPGELLKMYGKEKLPMEIARIELRKAYGTANSEEAQNLIKHVADVFKKSSSFALEAKLTDHEIQLQNVQVELESALGGSFIGSSLTDTLYRCILMGAGKRAKKIRADFQVPNKRWWWIKIRALAETGRWEAMRSFADPSKNKSPIGYKPFAEVCYLNGNSSESRYYAQLMPNDETKVMFYVQLQAWKEAFEVVETLDFPEDTLWKMRNKVKDPRIHSQIDTLIEKYQTKGADEGPEEVVQE